MKTSTRNLVIAAILLAILALGLWFAHGRVHFDWANLGLQLRTVDWGFIAAGFAAIYLSATLRAVRWRILLGHVGEGHWWSLIPSQYIGFTVIALFGRVADLARPYLVARRTKTAVATQLAVYSIERAFDLAAAAILFSLTLAFAPKDMPHHEAFARAGLLSLAATAFLAVFALAVRFAGATLAKLARRVFRMVSESFAESLAAKIVDFQQGMKTIATLGQFFGALGWSLVLWALIAYSYYASAHSFRSSPALATLTVPGTMLLMATSMGGSLLQLPVVGWFTQIAVLAGAFHLFFGAPLEVASACGAVTFVVTTLSIVPGGLITAKAQGIGLRDAAHSGEQAAEVSSTPVVN